MSYTGFYINLDRSRDRRAAMEARLATLNPAVEYRRFPAIDGNPSGRASKLTQGQVGCFASHYFLLGLHLSGETHLHVMEDDVVVARYLPMFIEQIVSSGMLDQYDILFTETALPPAAGFHRSHRQRLAQAIERDANGLAIKIAFSTIPYISGTTSYLMNRRSIALVHDLLGQELEKGPNLPIDLFIRDQAAHGRLRIGCLFPFIATVNPGGFSSVATPGKSGRLPILALELLRYSYFVECDLSVALNLSVRLPTNPSPDSRERLHARLFAYMISDIFENR